MWQRYIEELTLLVRVAIKARISKVDDKETAAGQEAGRGGTDRGPLS